MPVQQCFASCGNDYPLTGRFNRRRHALNGQIFFLEALFRVAGPVFDAAAGSAGIDTARHVVGNIGGIIGIAVLKVGTYRNVHGRCDLSHIAQGFIERDGTQRVRPAKAEGKPAAGCPQCLEAMGRKDFS